MTRLEYFLIWYRGVEPGFPGGGGLSFYDLVRFPFSSGIESGFSGGGGLSFYDLVRIFFSSDIEPAFSGEGVYPFMTWSEFLFLLWYRARIFWGRGSILL